MSPQTPRDEQVKKPSGGGLGNIDEERGDPGRGHAGKGLDDKENPTRRDNERQEPGVEEHRG